MQIDRPLTLEELKALSYSTNEEGEPMTETDFKQEILDTIDHRLIQYINMAKRKLSRLKTLTELE